MAAAKSHGKEFSDRQTVTPRPKITKNTLYTWYEMMESIEEPLKFE